MANTSASNLFRRALCPGSEAMEEGLPDDNTQEAREGTLLHHYDAHPELDREVLKPEQRDLLDISAGLDKFIFSRIAQTYQLNGTDETSGYVEHREVALNYKALPGHADLVRYYRGAQTALIIDKKFGYRQQTPAALNKQLRAYAVMVAEMVTLKGAIVAITQPRMPFSERVTIAAYTAEDINLARLEIDLILQTAKENPTKLVAGEEQCRYCRAKVKCPAYAAVTQPLTIAAGGSAAIAVDVVRELELASPEKVSMLLRAIQFADFIKDQVRDIGRAMVVDGRLPGWKLGAASTYRKIADAARAIALLHLKGDLTKDEILECCSPALTKLRDKLRQKTGCTWKEANATIDKTLAEVLEFQERKPPLLPTHK